ncbi:N-acetyltransferase [Luteitalea sp. TBR-22]|uniref:GNAT family N-acetyltransferase n=1 Tax=Luteitalea sp. TBR-22 TaxID=2802971 RepID=UPI001AFB219C|nr:N-acetyltransferase [Luteitalea sp. TBR-22]BCS34747.1 N-acetyltransferase [Luteitalea sp. TBR-22]
MNWAIRQGTPADADALAIFGRRVFIETYGHGVGSPAMEAYLTEHYTPGATRRVLADPAVTTLVATGEPDGAWAAYAQLRRVPVPDCVTDPTALQIWRFYVDRPWHGRGLARVLMTACLEAIRAQGARTAWLMVWEHNARALAFYRKEGFEVVGQDVFRLADEEHIDPVLVRALQ